MSGYHDFQHTHAGEADAWAAQAKSHTRRLRVKANLQGASLGALLYLLLYLRARTSLSVPEAVLRAVEQLILPTLPVLLLSAIGCRLYFRSRTVTLHTSAPWLHNAIFHFTEFVVGVFCVGALAGALAEAGLTFGWLG